MSNPIAECLVATFLTVWTIVGFAVLILVATLIRLLRSGVVGINVTDLRSAEPWRSSLDDDGVDP